ncbi:3-hydroxyalkanoate synthetase [Xenophilus sp. AP218F]|nr:3-hydroxyalkanoate synthetase [Xenophilus sp. AP218F]
MWSQAASWSGGIPFAQPVFDYWLDACQRSVLYWDALYDRGEAYLEHCASGKPPVLVFEHRVIMDGRTLPEPCNYALAAIVPPENCPPTNPALRPFVVIDPRAGHGPGIGGFKMDSEIGIALQQGHPCYFVMFFPLPEPGQTIESVAKAEAAFIQHVNALHPDADGKPFVIGNCQGGWALAMLASAAPDLVGPILLAGSPLSYWAGVRGKNPMRYSGGLLGGTWSASLAGDIGNGHFDGAHLVENFEKLDPANTWWKKPYNLYAKVDTERQRFLDFERWWGGHYLLNKQEMEWISQHLFVGNDLSHGKIVSHDSKLRVDMRAIRSPIVVFASWGDNITPPQQALNWIPDLYDSVEDIRDNEQTIIYCLHNKVGHLGIFVSAGVANKEHSEFANALDLIDVLAPGLYEAVIEDIAPDAPGQEYIEGRYIIRFEARDVSDILALDDGRDDEHAFEVVKRVSEINQGLYNRFVSPTVQAFSNEASAQIMRELHPARLERTLMSPRNPALWWLKPLADQVRAQRRPVAASNPLWQWQERVSEAVVQALNQYRDLRDASQEQLFQMIYESPLLATMVGVQPPREKRSHAVTWETRELAKLKREALEPKFEQGTLADGFIRLLVYVGIGMGVIDERPFNAIRRTMRRVRNEYPLTLMQLKDTIRRQVSLVRLDPQRALAGLRSLLPEQRLRHQAWMLSRDLLLIDRRDIPQAQQERLDAVAAMLELSEQDKRAALETSAIGDAKATAAPEIVVPAQAAQPASKPAPAGAAKKAAAKPASRPAKS